ncbi:leucine-rich repeat serine/threonine-protein kinase 1 isoform X2 [Spea bombifrons]|uniref:leucine-rich repeat serine/threonine-protein kinase 1 isoform X2 n=1 Tax=Spea bombifrons TaxID=233779 RepID=UPI00234A07C5|nr:leucine-rich repeat serine/threonine-protein kinase 1 isoform X2 [Spea bombifrons]
MMYWCVGTEACAGSRGGSMDSHNGSAGMGNKQAMPAELTINQSPVVAEIQDAYCDGERDKARDLVKKACDESIQKHEKYQLLRITAAYGDLPSVRFLLQEAQMVLPTEPSDDNPAVMAAHFGHVDAVTLLLDSLPDVLSHKPLLNWMLVTACEQGHMGLVKLLVLTYCADPDCYALRNNEFPVLKKLPLYATIMAGHEDIAEFLLQNGAGFCSYILMDSPETTKRLLRRKIMESSETRQQMAPESSVCVKWSSLRLPWVDLDWFIDISCQIVELDISTNCLVSLPSVVPWGLLNLQKLNLSDNQLCDLPSVQSSEEIICSRLLEVDVSNNKLTCLPPGFLHLSRLQKLCASRNYMVNLFKEDGANWIGLRRLQELDVSDNRISELPISVFHCFKSLRRLNVSRNKLKVFPEPWACPLKICKASNNAIENLPENLSLFWRNHLLEVDFSDNTLKDVPKSLFQLEALQSLKLSGNQLTALPPVDSWCCTHLKCLDLSRNQLGRNEDGVRTRRMPFFATKSRTRAGTEAGYCLEFPLCLSDSLEVLYLNDNQLESVPYSVCYLKSLTELYLGSNPGIRELPAELGQLASLWQLDLEDLNITNVPVEIRKEGPVTILAFLRAQLRKAERCRLVKMMIVGPPRQGKSSLFEVLQTGKVCQQMQGDNTLRTTRWELQKPVGIRAKVDSVQFHVWDIGGSSAMSAVNQCFFTDKALYVVVWNLALGEEAVANLQFWLLNIEAKAPNAAVLVVGTHLDFIETKFRLERIATLRAYVLALCRSPSGSRATGFPDITIKHLHELSCKTLEGLDSLRQLIFQAACNMKDVGSTIGSQKLVGRLIPRSYLNLQEAVLAQQQSRAQEDQVQYLTDEQIEQIIEQNPGNDIRDYEDMQTDTSHGLRNLYFLDPVWLSECLERIINIKSSKSVARNGVIKAEDLRMLLVGTGFTRQTEEQYFQFLAKFEIALPVASNSYLLPHLLPSKPGLDIHCLRQLTGNTVQRVFKMSFVPVGFWQRFIARMLISLAEMDLQLFENKKNTKPRNRKSVVYSFTGNQRNRCSTFRVKRNQTIYWQEGLMVTFDGGYLSVESSDINWKKKKSGGIKIICQSEMRDFSAMAFITDHVNSLIDQWFPALTATESDGTLLMEQYVLCHCCTALMRKQEGEQEEGDPNYFNMEDCVLAAVDKDYVECPNHPEVSVPLQELVPEIFMTDFPLRLFLDIVDLEYLEDNSNILGQGGSGTIIYRAVYKKKPVAVKMFQIKKYRTSAEITKDTMFKHLQAMDVMRNFCEFRQEASMLHSLQHPCIVSLIGISIHPLCFALELAPLGSLNTVLTEKKQAPPAFMPLGHMLTQRISYQIASGLSYLHKKNIIFCDLKSDNILVWSLDVRDAVNIKLSDYGISRLSFHEGALGVEGTPGYQAPEIRPRVVYDEKVDMFSYGMVIYELLSGQRPSLGQHQLQISKKLSKGIRPVLGRPEEVQFHRLQELMMECWDTKPEKRPLAASVVRRMNDPSFTVFKYQLLLGAQETFCSSRELESTVVFWVGTELTRNYTVVDVEKGSVEVRALSCPGMRMCSQVKVQNSLWISTEDQKISIYSLQGMCPLSAPQKVLDTPAIVTCFLAVTMAKNSCLVFAGMSDSLVAVFPVNNGIPTGDCSYICSRTANRSMFKIGDEDPRQNPYPVLAMEISNGGSEVWYSNGPGILVVDCTALEVSKRLDPYNAPSSIVSMTTSMDCNKEETVWCLDDKTNSLVMYHAGSYQVCARYFCGDCSPLRDMFTVKSLSELAPITLPVTNSQCPAHTSIIYSHERGTQLISHQDSVTDYCSVSSLSSSSIPQGGGRSSCSLPSTPVSYTSVPFSTDSEDPDASREQRPRIPSESWSSKAPPSEEEKFCVQAVKVLAVKDLIWVPRRGGDIVIIGLEKESGGQRGRVLAVLRAKGLENDGIFLEAAAVCKDSVVCCLQSQTLGWCLTVWRNWGAAEFDIFYHSSDELRRLETCMRKRR